jgi:hypothetical protein
VFGDGGGVAVVGGDQAQVGEGLEDGAASRLLRIADATALRAGLDPGDLCVPSGRKYGQAQPAPPRTRRVRWPPAQSTKNAGHYVNWRSIVRRNGKITRIRYEEVSTV